MDFKEDQSLEQGNENNLLYQEGIDSIRGESVSRQEWVDHGIIDVPVADLPMPEDVDSQDDFNHHISWDDAKSATERLPQIQQEVKNGKGRDDFHLEDQQQGLDYSQGNERIFDLYYGSDPVVLDKIGEKYDIVSGRHRVYAAKALGLESIPARVKEKIGG